MKRIAIAASVVGLLAAGTISGLLLFRSSGTESGASPGKYPQLSAGTAQAEAQKADTMDHSNQKKKIYADYHSPRYTREHDGALGVWQLDSAAADSKAEQTRFTYNADLLDENGHHQLASMFYPLVGMQSQLDPDYNEYQILLAKTAHIDGFFVEWGSLDHSSQLQLEALTKVAVNYGFQIGINWCDAWSFKPGTGNPAGLQRAARYLLDDVYTRPTAVLRDGRPLILLFGGGMDAGQFSLLRSELASSRIGKPEPLFVRRAPISGKLEGGKVRYSLAATEWHQIRNGQSLMDGVFGWIPTRVRAAASDGSGLHRQWDVYAEKEDVTGYLDALHGSFENDAVANKLRIGTVTPGFDNRGSAGWGTTLSYIPREEGETYRTMWEYEVSRREHTDIVYIASWNDYSEGHQIEPTIQDQGREMATTEQYAARWKGIPSDSSGLAYPGRLFSLRQAARYYAAAGFDVRELQAELDEAGQAISGGQYNAAEACLVQAERLIGRMELQTERGTLTVVMPSHQATVRSVTTEGSHAGPAYELAQGLYIALDDELADLLNGNPFQARFTFEYEDSGNGSLKVTTDTTRPPNTATKGNYSVVAEIKKTGTNEWKKATFPLYKTNSVFRHRLAQQSDIAISGAGRVRGLSLEVEWYRKR